MSWTLLTALVLALGLALMVALQRRAELARMAVRVRQRERAVRQGAGWVDDCSDCHVPTTWQQVELQERRVVSPRPAGDLHEPRLIHRSHPLCRAQA